MNALTVLLPLLFLVPPGARPDDVRIGLFSLFKPEVVEVSVASGDGANLTASGGDGHASIRRGESIAIRLSGGRLHIALNAGHSFIATETRITPSGSAILELNLPGRIKRAVRGELLIDTGSGGRGPLRIVLTTDREAAVASVVAAETSQRKTEALKALAVVVRTFMFAHAGRHSSEGYDFCDTTHCQFYRGEQALSDLGASTEIEEAVEATRGEVLGFKGRTVEGYYTASCGGLTVTPSMLWGGSTLSLSARFLSMVQRVALRQMGTLSRHRTDPRRPFRVPRLADFAFRGPGNRPRSREQICTISHYCRWNSTNKINSRCLSSRRRAKARMEHGAEPDVYDRAARAAIHLSRTRLRQPDRFVRSRRACSGGRRSKLPRYPGLLLSRRSDQRANRP